MDVYRIYESDFKLFSIKKASRVRLLEENNDFSTLLFPAETTALIDIYCYEFPFYRDF